MNSTDQGAKIPPVQLGSESRFSFRCHQGVSCFTACCKGISIMLTPYDIIRMKNRLQMRSDEFLAVYTTPQILEKTDLPMVTLKMLDDDEKTCPFVRKDGCIIYTDRPSTCRYYPLGVATLSYKTDDDSGFYFFINEPHCRGFEEDTEWTVASWRKDQGVDAYDEINAEWTDLIVRKRSVPANLHLTEKIKQMFFTASYDIDRFRRFVFESSFLKLYEIDETTVDRARSDDVALLQLGFRWLKWLVFKDGDFAMDDQSAAERRERWLRKQT